jgi:shikimate kinase
MRASAVCCPPVRRPLAVQRRKPNYRTVQPDLPLTDRIGQRHVAVVYLRAAPETLAERILQDEQPRPLLLSDPLERLREMHAQRDHRYQALAQITEDVEGRSTDQLAAEALNAPSGMTCAR